jgi:hypothetical protein
MPATPEGVTVSLEVLQSSDGGKTWRALPLRLSPWARVKCLLLDGGWPPESCQRLSCDGGKIEFEFISPDYWDNWPLKTWCATYQPFSRWWSLRLVAK